MCLVSFIPTPQGWILSSNRDESPARNAQHLKREIRKNGTILYPVDVAGGSWIIGSSDGRALCLLNGGFENHTRVLPYKMSRGIMMRQIFEFDDYPDFIAQFDFFNMEPFTLIMVDSQGVKNFIWTGTRRYVELLDDQKKHVWSSSTLYDQNERDARARKWHELLSGQDPGRLSKIRDLHLHRSDNYGDTDLYLNRNEIVRTISHTQLIKTKSSLVLSHHNLLDHTSQMSAV